MVQDSWDSEQLLFEHCTSLNCTAMDCTRLHCTALHCKKLYCIHIRTRQGIYGQIKPFA